MYSGCRIATVEAVSNTVPGTACYLLEWYRPDPTDDQLERIATALAEGAAASSADGFPVQLIMTLAVPADDVVFAVNPGEVFGLLGVILGPLIVSFFISLMRMIEHDARAAQLH